MFNLLLQKAIQLTILFPDHILTFSVAPWILSYLQRPPQLQEKGLSSLLLSPFQLQLCSHSQAILVQATATADLNSGPQFRGQQG